MKNHIQIDFHGDALTAIETPDGVFVPVKPIADRLGLSWPAQYRKLTGSELRWGVAILAIPSAGGAQETACLPLNRLAMWLATIHPAKVRADVRGALEAYQNEAADVLDRHFRLRLAAEEAALAETRDTLARARALALAANPVWNRIARLKEAGVTALAMPYMARLPVRQCQTIIAAMIDGGLIEVDFSTPRHPEEFYREVRLTRWGQPFPDPAEAPEAAGLDPDAPTPLEAAIEELSRPGSPAAPAEG